MKQVEVSLALQDRLRPRMAEAEPRMDASFGVACKASDTSICWVYPANLTPPPNYFSTKFSNSSSIFKDSPQILRPSKK